MDLLLPSEQNVRRSAKDTGKVHRVRYGNIYSLQDSGQENIEQAPISWLEGLSDNDGGEIVEVPGIRFFSASFVMRDFGFLPQGSFSESVFYSKVY